MYNRDEYMYFIFIILFRNTLLVITYYNFTRKKSINFVVTIEG